MSDRSVAGSVDLDRAAFLRFQDSIWFAVLPPRSAPWRRPLLDLVQGIYRVAGRHAHALLRRPIHAVGETPLDRAVLQVAARRGRTDREEVEARRREWTSLQWIDVTDAARDLRDAAARDLGVTDEIASDDEALLANAARAAASARRVGPRRERDRRVGAALAIGDRVRATAVNRNATHRCEHAEWRLVHGWTERTGSGLPTGARIGVTLQCCRMCAALIAAAADGPVEVVYAEEDRGRLARGTVLQQLGWERPAGDPCGSFSGDR